MPCRDDWPSPTGAQQRSQHAAKLLIYVYKKMGKPVPRSLEKDAVDCYCETDHVKTLCSILKAMTENEREQIIYARNRDARDLADWWEDHIEADRQREAAERAEAEKRELRVSALKKLTKEEVEALEIPTWRFK